jgi:hypothetical protein
LQVPFSEDWAQVLQSAAALPAWVPEGASARKLAMKPPGPDSEVTRMHTLRVFAEQVMLLPYEVVPATFCWASGTPAGKSAGPPLSPSQTPGVCAAPPWLDEMV